MSERIDLDDIDKEEEDNFVEGGENESKCLLMIERSYEQVLPVDRDMEKHEETEKVISKMEEEK